MEKPFWEDIYKNKDGDFLFNQGKPSIEIIEITKKIIPNSKILDIGCGDGRNSIYMAEQGFKVAAFDVSGFAIGKLKYIAKQRKLQLNVFVQDMVKYKFTESFDVIITHGCLHLIKRSEWLNLIENIKLHTKKDGYNIHAVFTDTIESSEDMKSLCKGLFQEGELFNLYNDWNIELQESYILEDEHPGGIKHKHPINKIVARNKME